MPGYLHLKKHRMSLDLWNRIVLFFVFREYKDGGLGLYGHFTSIYFIAQNKQSYFIISGFNVPCKASQCSITVQKMIFSQVKVKRIPL